jgi:hypothetical protein
MNYTQQLIEIGNSQGIEYVTKYGKMRLLMMVIESMNDEEADSFLYDTFMMLDNEINDLYEEVLG